LLFQYQNQRTRNFENQEKKIRDMEMLEKYLLENENGEFKIMFFFD
jgi:hypothetical protein